MIRTLLRPVEWVLIGIAAIALALLSIAGVDLAEDPYQ